MIDWSLVKEYQNKKNELQIDLSKLLESKRPTKDEVNSICAEIRYYDNQIKKILGSKELERQQKLTTPFEDVKNIKRFREFKEKYEKMSNLTIAYNRIDDVITKKLNESYENAYVKVKAA